MRSRNQTMIFPWRVFSKGYTIISVLTKQQNKKEKFCLADFPRFLFLNKVTFFKKDKIRHTESEHNRSLGLCKCMQSICLKYLSFQIPTTHL